MFGSEQHEDYHVMSHISKKSFLEDTNQTQIMPQHPSSKSKKGRSKAPQNNNNNMNEPPLNSTQPWDNMTEQ